MLFCSRALGLFRPHETNVHVLLIQLYDHTADYLNHELCVLIPIKKKAKTIEVEDNKLATACHFWFGTSTAACGSLVSRAVSCPGLHTRLAFTFYLFFFSPFISLRFRRACPFILFYFLCTLLLLFILLYKITTMRGRFADRATDKLTTIM